MAELETLQAGLEELRRRIEAYHRRLAEQEVRWRALGVPAPERMARLEQTDPLVAGVLRVLASAGRAYEATGIPGGIAAGVERGAELAGQAGRSLAAGTGDVIRTAGGAARWLGAEGIGQRLEQAGAALAERYGEEPTEEFSWRSLLSPRFWATTVMRTVPFTLSLIPAAIGGAYVGSRLGARLGAWGSSILSALGAAAASRPLESALEAGGAYQEALARGMSPEEAERAANEVFRRNLALAGLDAAQWAAAFMRVPPSVQRLAGRLGSQAAGRAAIAAGRMVGAALPEAGEEYVQEAIQRQALGEPHPWRFDPAMQESAALGAIIGVGFGAAGSVYDFLRDATVRRLPPEQRQQYQQIVQRLTQSGLSQREAEVAALDQVAQTPEGGRATTEAAQEVAARLQQQAPSQPAPPAEQARPAPAAPPQPSQAPEPSSVAPAAPAAQAPGAQAGQTAPVTASSQRNKRAGSPQATAQTAPAPAPAEPAPPPAEPAASAAQATAPAAQAPAPTPSAPSAGASMDLTLPNRQAIRLQFESPAHAEFFAYAASDALRREAVQQHVRDLLRLPPDADVEAIGRAWYEQVTQTVQNLPGGSVYRVPPPPIAAAPVAPKAEPRTPAQPAAQAPEAPAPEPATPEAPAPAPAQTAEPLEPSQPREQEAPREARPPERPEAPPSQAPQATLSPATPAEPPAQPADEQASPFPTLEWGPGKPGYIRTLPSHAEQRRFHAEAKEVGWIDQPYGHKQTVYWYRGRLVRIQSAAGAGIGDRRAYLHAVDPDGLGDAFHWRDNQAARNAQRHWEAQRKARQAGAEQAPATPEAGSVTIRENPERDGIEIRFASKPPVDVLQMLHQAGFRWSRRQGLWWARRSDKTRAVADQIRQRMGGEQAPAASDERTPEAPRPPAQAPAQAQTQATAQAEAQAQAPAPAPAQTQAEVPTAAEAAPAEAPAPETPQRVTMELEGGEAGGGAVAGGGRERPGEHGPERPGPAGAELDEARPVPLAGAQAPDVSAAEARRPTEGRRRERGAEDRRDDAGSAPPRPGVVDGGGGREGAVGAAPERGGRAEPGGGARPSGERSARNLRITKELAEDLEPKGPKDKFRRNVAAIRLLKQLQAEGRPATPEEQAVLARFSGWGSLPQVFDERNQEWAKEREELRGLLTKEEWDAARHSTLNAHYSSPAEIRAMWDAVLRMGFKGGRVLEPSAGVGHFLGFVPDAIVGSTRFTAVELDSISGGILRLLYPRADVRVMGFEELNVPDNFYDLAISNVPFGDYPVPDPRYRRSGMANSIHNYFFAKSLDKVRPGGVVIFITSRYTMDAQSTGVREYLANRADLLMAVRLPNTAQAGAGTAVTTDILVLRKRAPGEEARGEPWIQTEYVSLADGTRYPINEYFARHPERILGRHRMGGGLYSGYEYRVEPDGRDLETALREAFAALPPDALAKPVHKPTEEATPAILMPPPPGMKPGAYGVVDSQLVQYDPEQRQVVPVELKGEKARRIRAFVELKTALSDYYRAQLRDAPEAEIEALRKRYEKTYDAFVKKWGGLHDEANERALDDDPDYYMVLATEEWDPKAKRASKGPAFSKRTLHPPKWPERADTAHDALMIVLAKTGRVDMDEIAHLAGKTVEQVEEELRGLIFHDPDEGWVPRDEYLSGNVREKLRRAEIEAAHDPRYQVNVEALRAVQPPWIPFAKMDLNFHAPFIPEHVMRDFVSYVTEIPASEIDVRFSELGGGWEIEENLSRRKSSYLSRFSTDDLHALDIIRTLLKGRRPVVRRTDPETRKSRIDPEATALAQERADAIVAEFRRWLEQDAPGYAQEIERLYNETVNAYRRPQYDGSHLTLPGSNPAIKLRPYQKNVVWRIIRSGNTLIAHPVGAGKTFEMAAAAMELRRLGVVRKPMFVVPNHLVDQFARDFHRLYPQANVLVIRREDVEGPRLAHAVARIAAGDWDAVIMRQSSFTKIPVSPDAQRAFWRELADEIRAFLGQLYEERKTAASRSGRRGKGKPDSRLIKQIEKALAKMEARIAELDLMAQRRENVISFEQTGVDALFVDEAHLYKNLFYYSTLRDVKGLGDPDGSGRAYDMLMKVRYLQRLNGGRGVVFATGTPVSNSLVELYTLFRYLRPDLIGDSKLGALDPWLASFGRVTRMLEAKPDGSYGVAHRLSRVLNPKAVIDRFHQFADVIGPEELKDEKPAVKGGRRQVIVSPGNDELRAYIESLASRLESIRRGVDPREDNYLKVNNDARLAAIDLRLVNPNATDDPRSKLNLAVENIYNIWERTKDQRLSQVVFLDVGVPKSGKASRAKRLAAEEVTGEEAAGSETEQERALRTQLYRELKEKLIARGVPEQEIAFVHDAANDTEKQALFDAVNEGQVRIIIGTTSKMGVGTNMQKRLIALHHLDTPWRPADLEQREGRILRPGNQNPEVELYTYVTKGSFDEYLWQLIESKADMIWRLLKGDVDESAISDPFSEAMVADAAVARSLASGKPEVMEHVQVTARLSQLRAARRAWEAEIANARLEIRDLQSQVEAMSRRLDDVRDDIDHRVDTSGDKFRAVIMGQTYTERKEAQEALSRAVAEHRKLETSGKIGEIGGFTIYYDFDAAMRSIRDTGQPSVQLRRRLEYTASPSIASIEASLRNLPQTAANLEASIEERRQRMAGLQERANQTTFHGDDEIRQLEIRKQELEEILGGEAADDTPPEVPQDAETTEGGQAGAGEDEPVLGMPDLEVDEPEVAVPEEPPPVRTAPPPSEAAIVSRLSELFDVAIRAGRLTLRKARGEYKVQPEVIRVKAANDLRAMAHEIGHHLAYTMGLKPDKYRDLEALGQELYPKAGPKKWRQEGLAEFVALYFENPENAREQAPVFARDFEEALKANPTIAAAVTEAQAMWQAYFGGTPEARIKAHIVRDMPKPKPWLTPMEVFNTLWVDDLYPVYKAVRDLRGGEPTDQVLRDAYALARLARGRFRRAEAWLVGKPMDLEGKPVGPSLKEILEPVRDRIDDFEEYLVVRRAKELMERRNAKGEPAPIETGMNPDDVQAEFERLHADPVLRKAAEQLDAYQDALLRVLVQSGRVSQDLAEKVRQLNRYYVPFQRVFYDSDRGPGGGGRMRWADLPDPIRRIRGSARPIFSPLASVIRNTIVFHDLAARNLVGAALAAEAEKAEGMGWLMEKVPRPVQPVSVNLERLRDALEEAGILASDLEDADLERVAVLFYPVERARGKEQRENIAVIYRNGKPEFWQMHPDLYRAMEAMDNPPAHWIIRILSLPTRVLRAGATLAPEYALRNPIRDTYESWLYRKLGYRPIDALRGLMHVIKRDDPYWDWVNSGGAQSTFVSVERDYLNRDLNRLIGKQTTTEKAVRILRAPIDILEAFSQATEEATRVGAYLRALEKQGGRTPESRARAALWSRDVSLDFNRAGLHGRQYNAIKAFFNARVQDLDRLARAFRADPWGMTLRSLLYVTLPSVALYLINREDPAYEELPRWRKDLFWCLRVGGRWLFIPKPGTIGVLFGSVPERFLEYVDKQDPKALDDLGKTIADSALPGDPTSAFDWLPDALLPWVEASAGPGGWDSFQERPIVPMGEQRLEPWAQYGPQTSELAKGIGRTFHVSPRKVDHVIYGYTGGLGRHALNLLDILAGHALEKRTLSELTPGLGGFTQRAYVASDSLDRFYQELDALEREYVTLREQLQRQGSNPNLARALMQNYQRLQQMRRVADRIAQLRNQQRQWLERPGVPADVKRRYADDYQRQMISLARQAIGRRPLPQGGR